MGVPCVMIRISSRKLNLLSMFSSVLCSVVWNVAGISDSPLNPFMNWYVPVDFPPRILKLQCFLISGCRGIWLYAYLRYFLENRKLPVLFLLSEIYLATESTRLSIDCFWYLFFSIASFSTLESSANLMDWSCFAVITTGLINLSEHFSRLIIWFVPKRCRFSLSTLSVRCNGTLRPLC